MGDLSGQQIKSYQIIELLGRGGMGDVYRAHQSAVDREVAIKVLRSELARNSDFIRSFDLEARTIANLENQHIVPLYDYWREGDQAYLVMRLLRGGSLRQILRQSWEKNDVNQLLRQIGEGLAVAHARGIVHGDLKPENIMLDEQRNAYLADFGLASDVVTGIDQKGYTPAYAAPEQIRRQRTTFQTDIYSLGVMLYELLTGRRPFTDATISEVEARHLNDPLPPVTELRPDLSLIYDEILWKATSKDPADRYTSVTALMQAFDQAVRNIDLSDEDTDRGGVPTFIANPYKGLRPFEYEDRESFFGRDKLTGRLVNRLRDERLLVVIGPSGSGKSSVVKAGLIPALLRGELTGSAGWFMQEMTPGDNPFGALAQVLLSVLNDPPPSLEDQLRADETMLHSLVQEFLPGKQNDELVLAIDQFEEVFTLGVTEADRSKFLSSIAHAVTAPASRLRIVLTLRADFYDRPLQYPQFGELVRIHLETVLPPDREELEAAIIKPAERYGIRLEPNLVNQIIASVGEQPGMLPLLQFALTQLFEKRTGNTLTLREFRKMNGVVGALATSAEELYASLSAVQQARARDLFLRLVTVNDEMEATRRRARRTELIIPGEPDPAMEQVIELFGRNRLLTFDHDPQTREPTIEIAHEALIRHWSTLRGWIEASRDVLRVQRQLSMAEREWAGSQMKPDFLAVGARLAQFEQLQQDSSVKLNREERLFLNASIENRRIREEEERKRIERELTLAQEAAEQQRLAAEAAQRLVEQERRGSTRLRMAAAALALFLLAAIGLAIVARDQTTRAESSEQTALARGSEVVNLVENITDVAQQVNAAGITLTGIQQTSVLLVATSTAQAGTLVQKQTEGAEIQATAIAQETLIDGNQTSVAVIQATSTQQAGIVITNLTEGAKIQTTALAQGTLIDSNQTSVAVIQATSTQQAGILITSQTESANIQATAVAQGTLIDSNQTEVANIQATSVGQAETLVGNQTELAVVQLNSTNQAVTLASQVEQQATNQTQVAVLRTSVADQQQFLATNQAESTEIARTSVSLLATGTKQVEQQATNQTQVAALQTSVATQEQLLATNQAESTNVQAIAVAQGTLIAGNQTEVANIQATVVSAIETATEQGRQLAEATGVIAGLGSDLEKSFNLSFSQNLAAQAELLLGAGDYQLAAFLAREANVVPDAPPDVQRILSLAAYTGPRDIKFHDNGAVNGLVYCPVRDSRGRITRDAWVSASSDRSLIYWQIRGGRLQIVQKLTDAHAAGVNTVTCDTSGNRTASGDVVGNIVIWSLADGTVATLPGLQLTPETPASDPTAQALDALAGLLNGTTPTPEFAASLPVLSLAFNPGDPNFLLVGYESVDTDETIGRLVLWNLADEVQETEFRAHDEAVASAVFSPDGTRFVSASLNGEIILWDVVERDILKRIRYPAGVKANSLAYNTAGDRIIAAASDGAITLYDAETLQSVSTLNGHTAAVTAAIYNETDTYIISGSADRSLILWDVATGQLLRRFRAHEQDITAVAFGVLADYIVSASLDQSVILWDIKSGAELRRFGPGTLRDIPGVDYARTSGGNLIVAANGDNRILLCNDLFPAACVEDQSTDRHAAPVQVVAFSPDGTRVLSGDAQGTLILWAVVNSSRLEFLGKVQASDSEIRSIAFSPDGTVAVTSSLSQDRSVRLWLVDRLQSIAALPTGTPAPETSESDSNTSPNIDSLRGSAANVLAVAYSSAGQIATGSAIGELILWQFDTVENRYVELKRLGSQGMITALAYSPDGKILVSASEDRTLTSWDVDSESTGFGAQLRTFRQHTGAVRSVAFSPDGSLIISSSDDGTVIVWDIVSGVSVSVLVGHTGAVNSVRFNARGTQAVSTGSDGQIILWQIRNRTDLLTWVSTERYISPLDDKTTIGGQNGCDIRREYNLSLQCDESGKLISPTPYLTPTRTETATPTPTSDLSSITPSLTPTPSETLMLEDSRSSENVIAALQQEAVIDNRWYEAERIDWSVLDLSNRRDQVSSRVLDQVYENFVLHAVIDWGPGSLQDRCGFSFWRIDRDNYHLIQIDQLDNIYYSARFEGEWQTADQSISGEVSSLAVSTRGLTRLILVARGDTVQVYVLPYVPGNITLPDAYEPTIDRTTIVTDIPRGYVALAATVFNRSRESSCTFKDVWIADIDRSEAPSPTPTFTPPATLVYVTPEYPLPALVIDQLVSSDRGLLPARSGYIAEQISRLVVDLSDLPANTIQWISIENPGIYRDFVMGAVLNWGAGDPEDQCGFLFRQADNNNFYTLSLSRQGQLIFDEQEAGTWADSRTLDGRLIQTGIDDSNYVVLIGRETEIDGLTTSRFIVLLNGVYAGEIIDSTHPEGLVALAGSTFDESITETGCTFNQAWVWNLAEKSEPTPVPTLTPVLQPDSIEAGISVSGSLVTGGRDVWTYRGTAGEIVNIRSEALRPANDARPQSRINRRLLDIEVRVTYRDADGNVILLRAASDILRGQNTNVLIEQMVLPQDNEYQIEVYSWQNQTGGDYTLLVESAGQSQPITPTATPTAGE